MKINKNIISLPISLLIIIFIFSFTVGCSKIPFLNFAPDTTNNPNLLLGNPSGANANDPNNYLMIKPQFVLSYNRDKGIPNWVSWQINKSWLGSAERSNDFRPDDTLPKDWYRVTPSSYVKTGYDKGHMTPSADRSKTAEDNSATFLMTNIIPQAPDNNRGYWENLESYSRNLANQGQELYVIAGSYGEKEKIGKGKVVVPDRIYKIIVAIQPGSGIKGINQSTRVIAIDTPNQQNKKTPVQWTDFLTTVDALEKRTGYDFLSNVDSAIQKVIESKTGKK
jgi:endonuclease G, mitochondrial